MRTYKLMRLQRVAAPLDVVFEFFSVARNLERLTPSFLRFEVMTPEPITMRVGTVIDYRLRVHGVPLRWRSRIEEWEPGRSFVDCQLIGPYGLWHHRHEFSPGDPRGVTTMVKDTVHYQLPFGRLGVPALPFVQHDLRRIFAYRYRVVEQMAVAGTLTPIPPVSAASRPAVPDPQW
jgi:ligand-binding SRPBCC domain-containing protein